MKKRILIIIIMIISFIIMIISLFNLTACNNSKKEQELTDAMKFKEEYESLNGTISKTGEQTVRSLEISKDNPFIYKKATNILEMIENKETFVVYFGFSNCPWCRSVINPLINVATDLGITTIYYTDVKEIRDTLTINEKGQIETTKKGTNAYYQLLEKLNNVLADYTLTDNEGNEVATLEKRIYAPNIISIVNGVPINLTDGISPNQTDGYMELTDEIESESYEKIKCSIQCVADEKKVCEAKTKC